MVVGRVPSEVARELIRHVGTDGCGGGEGIIAKNALLTAAERRGMDIMDIC